MKILRCKDAATLWECLQKVKPKSSIKENIDNLTELLDRWRSLQAQSIPQTIDDAKHRFFLVFQIKKKIAEDFQAFFGRNDLEESSSSSSSSSSNPKPQKTEKGNKKEDRNNRPEKPKKEKLC